MLLFWILEKLYVIKQISERLLSCRIGFLPDPLTFQRREKASSHSIVIVVDADAYAGFHIVLL